MSDPSIKPQDLVNTLTQRILLVDDIPENIQLAGASLQSSGYDLSFASSGATAFDLLKQDEFDLILLDISMPDMDGFEVCLAIKANPDWQDIPVIFLTSSGDQASVLKAFEVGGADYVTKPYQAPELLARVKTHLDLRAKAQALAANNEALKLFLTVMAHDLKGPYTGLLGWAGILKKEYATMSAEVLAQTAEHIANSAQLSFDLLNNLLTWARSQTGHLNLRLVKLPLAPVCDEILEVYHESAKVSEGQIICNIPEGLFLHADREMFSTVLRNLIDNGLKFTKPGGRIFVTAKEVAGFVEISVSDTGVGMSAALLKKLFKIGKKVVSKPVSGKTGTGLGLLICAEFVRRHGCKIWAQSELKQGSTFTFTLPVWVEPA